jgi:hypothetical protein
MNDHGAATVTRRLITGAVAALLACVLPAPPHTLAQQTALTCQEPPAQIAALTQALNEFWKTDVKVCVIGSASSKLRLLPPNTPGSQHQNGKVLIDLTQLSNIGFLDDDPHYPGFVPGILLMYVMAHEWGHNLQGVNMGLYATHKVAFELQADCFSGFFIGSQHPGLNKQEQDRLYGRAATIGDSVFRHPDHGGTQQRLKAVRAGYLGFGKGQAPNVACGFNAVNTWSNSLW